MARTTFARTVVKTVCDVVYYDENNEKHEEKVEVFGKYDSNGAQHAVIKLLGTPRVLVKNVSYKSYYGTMSMVEFDLFCEKTNWKEW